MPRVSPGVRSASLAKAALEQEIARSGLNDQALLRAATKEAFERVNLLLKAYYADFSPKQQALILATVGAKPTSNVTSREKPVKAARPTKAPAEELPPRFWLPFSGETWSGRGRPPNAFLAWEGTVAHTEWKKRHPDERFPRYPG